MNKNILLKIIPLVLILFVSLAAIVYFLFTSNIFTSANINKKVEVNVLSFVDATEKDFQRYNNAFTTKSVELERDNYRLLKMNCEITNKNNFPISFEDVQVIDTDDFYLSAESADYEPTFCINGDESMCIDMYIYVNNDLKEDEIQGKLNDLDIVICAYRVNT